VFVSASRGCDHDRSCDNLFRVAVSGSSQSAGRTGRGGQRARPRAALARSATTAHLPHCFCAAARKPVRSTAASLRREASTRRNQSKSSNFDKTTLLQPRTSQPLNACGASGSIETAAFSCSNLRAVWHFDRLRPARAQSSARHWRLSTAVASDRNRP